MLWGKQVRRRKTESEVEEPAARSIYIWEANRKALKGLPAIVAAVYQMAFQAGQTKQNKQENK